MTTNHNICFPSWADNNYCAITVCDAMGTIIYMNDRSREVNSPDGKDRIGQNIMDCHNPHSQEIIKRLLSQGGTNAYTIDKHGVFKFIYQSAYLNQDGTVAGVFEISMPVPKDLPHYHRG